MWIVYLVLGVLAAVALAFLGMGVWIVSVLALLAMLVVAFFGFAMRGGGRRPRGQAPNVPDSQQASYEPQVDPNRTATGSTTGT